ncbi:nucleoside triphosphate pyrophosphohydrolase [Mycolicibacterium sp.]|uniref:nucleoside triphosphate pyrophosphohydrolase n=1 Tax=Mycolicibacterium sp. TaxID=2320850 RepID=UPI0037CCB8E7
MAKLVRDNIPGLIRASGRRAVTRQLDDDEFAVALLDKLAEETAEVRSAATAEAVLEEAADVLEVLLAIVEQHGYRLSDIVAAADEKRLKRGGFATRCWLGDQCLGY